MITEPGKKSTFFINCNAFCQMIHSIKLFGHWVCVNRHIAQILSITSKKLHIKRRIMTERYDDGKIAVMVINPS